MIQQNVFTGLLHKLFPHSEEKAELKRLHQMHDHCQCAHPCPNKVSFFDKMHHKGESLKLIAYVRAWEGDGAAEQTRQLKAWCDEHGNTIIKLFDHDTKEPEMDLHDALIALDKADGMIVTDLSRLVTHHDDPLRDLAPLVHHYFFHEPKHLITISEQIDTRTAEGQEKMVEFLKRLTDLEHGTC
jgi:hypothetical protein